MAGGTLFAKMTRKFEQVTLIVGLVYDPRRMPVLNRKEVSAAIEGQFMGRAHVRDFSVVLGSVEEVFGPKPRRRR